MCQFQQCHVAPTVGHAIPAVEDANPRPYMIHPVALAEFAHRAVRHVKELQRQRDVHGVVGHEGMELLHCLHGMSIVDEGQLHDHSPVYHVVYQFASEGCVQKILWHDE